MPNKSILIVVFTIAGGAIPLCAQETAADSMVSFILKNDTDPVRCQREPRIKDIILGFLQNPDARFARGELALLEQDRAREATTKNPNHATYQKNYEQQLALWSGRVKRAEEVERLMKTLDLPKWCQCSAQAFKKKLTPGMFAGQDGVSASSKLDAIEEDVAYQCLTQSQVPAPR